MSHAVRLLPLLLIAATAAAETGRYAARMNDGSRIVGNKFSQWHEESAQPTLEGKRLTDPANHFVWLLDRNLPSASVPSAGVEFMSGDFAPGIVTSRVASGSDLDPSGPFFRLELGVARYFANDETPQSIRVLQRFVRRIIWQRREKDDFQPNTVFLRDRRSMKFRAIRWLEGAISILESQGNRRIDFTEIAELHLTAENSWQSHFDELAVLCTAPDSRWLQIETTEGLKATASFERFRPLKTGNPNEPHQWVHGFQPAWSLDLLWLPNDSIRLRRAFTATQAPLSRFEPSKVVHRSSLSPRNFPWRRDENIQREPLRSGGLEFAFGFGTGTTTELTFSLPAGAVGLRGASALDRLAGRGGCAQAEIRVQSEAGDSQTLWKSPLMRGSDNIHDWGKLKLPADQGALKLTLAALAAHEDRPADADPLEIRDFVNWLDPIVEFDRKIVQREMDARFIAALPGMAGWKLQVLGAEKERDSPLIKTSFSDTLARKPGTYRSAVTSSRTLVWSREVSLGENDHWLGIAAFTPEKRDAKTRLEVRIDDTFAGETALGQWHEGQRELKPLVIPLPAASPKGETVRVEIRQISDPGAAPIDWRMAKISTNIPAMLEVYDEGNPYEQIAGPHAEETGDDVHFGPAALRIPAGGEIRFAFPQPLVIRDQPLWGDYRFFRYSMRKKGKGMMTVTLESKEGRKINYTAGPLTKPIAPGVRDIWNNELPDSWNTIFIDVFNDFGPCEISSVSVSVPDGEAGLFDFANFSAGYGEFDRRYRQPLASWRKPPRFIPRDRAAIALNERLIVRSESILVRLSFGEEDECYGVFANNSGEILTAGHRVIGPNRPVKIVLRDGRTIAGKTRGVNREVDIGLVDVIEKKENFPSHGVHVPGEYLFQEPLATLMAHRDAESIETIRLGPLSVQRGAFTVQGAISDEQIGSPLLDLEGRVLGVIVGKQSGGRLQCGIPIKFSDYDERLRRGEVWGRWMSGTEPTIQATLRTRNEGLTISEVDPRGAAAQAGVKKGDRIVECEGKPILGVADWEAIVSGFDPGKEISLKIMRAEESLPIKVKLQPRKP